MMKLFKNAVIGFLVLSVVFHYGYKVINNLLEDDSFPVITVSSDTVYADISVSDAELLKGVTAKDQKDGDVSDTLIVEKLSEFDDQKRRKITYAAFDSDGHISRAEANLIYNNYTSPRFSLSAPLRYFIGSSSNFLDSFSCTDCIEGDITHKIKIVYDNEDAQTAIYYGGVFDITVKATNICGDTSSLTASVEIRKNDYNNIVYAPTVNLTDYIVYVEKDSEFAPKDYLKSIAIGKTEYELVAGQATGKHTLSKQRVNVKSSVDTSVPGQYNVIYNYTTTDGYSGSTELIVIVL